MCLLQLCLLKFTTLLLFCCSMQEEWTLDCWWRFKKPQIILTPTQKLQGTDFFIKVPDHVNSSAVKWDINSTLHRVMLNTASWLQAKAWSCQREGESAFQVHSRWDLTIDFPFLYKLNISLRDIVLYSVPLLFACPEVILNLPGLHCITMVTLMTKKLWQGVEAVKWFVIIWLTSYSCGVAHASVTFSPLACLASGLVLSTGLVSMIDSSFYSNK